MNLLIEPGASSVLSKIGHLLTEQGVKSYLIGGFVRDLLLGQPTADIDIAVAADALEVASRVAEALGGKYVPLDEVNRVARVVLFPPEADGVSSTRDRWGIDFATLRGSIEQDLAERDFTIDAIAIDMESLLSSAPVEGRISLAFPALIDPFHSRDDLQKKLIKVVTRTAFQSDAARLLRAVRLAAELGFSINEETETLIRRDSHLITSVSGERVREELLRLLAVPIAGQFLTYLDELGLLTAIIPELAQTKGVVQPKEHHWDVFVHSLKTVAAVEFLLRQGKWAYAGDVVLATVPWSPELETHFNQEVSGSSTRMSLLKLVALLHDIAKPQTKAFDETGRMRFLGHASEGSEVVVKILERLRFSAREIKLAELMVKYHLRPTQMSQDGLPTQRAIYRYFRDTADAGIDILFLSLADHLASRGPDIDLREWEKHTGVVAYVMAERSEKESLKAPPKLIDGHDLINIFGLSPGPLIGELLEAVRESQGAGEIKTREEALSYVTSLVSMKKEENKN